MRRPRIPYYNDFTNITTDYQVTSDCNAISFINQGTSPVKVGKTILLQTGQSFGIDGNEHEFDTTIYDVVFKPNSPTDTKDLVVVRKVYNSNPGDQWVYPGLDTNTGK